MGYLFREKWYIKGYGVGPPGGASPYKNLLSNTPPPPPPRSRALTILPLLKPSHVRRKFVRG